MKITFPHFGNVYIPVKALFDGLGVDYVIPPATNAKALELGILHSPEEICLPFKLMIGNYLQSIEAGADTVILPGSCGPCRFGEYCELQMKLMNRIGLDIDFIVLDAPKDIGRAELMTRIKKISAGSSKPKPLRIKAVADAYRVMKLIDGIEADARYLAGYEKHHGDFKKLIMDCRKAAVEAPNPASMIKILKQYKNKVKQIELDKNKTPMKIAIIGEIYTIIEPFSNLYIEDKLMDYGVSTKRRLSPSWWVDDMLMSIINLNSMDIRKASKEYLPLGIGGHAVECVGEAVLAEKENFDGIIQIFPLGCMPEIVTKAILPTISKDKDIPILTLVVDEMTGEGGYITRIEAFMDLIERRKKCII